MLFVVLLSAAPTGAAPRTLLVGSAFDPATTSVAMGAKRPRLDVAEERKGSKPDDLSPLAGSSLHTTAAEAHREIVPPTARRSGFAVAATNARVNLLAHSRGARAPPLI